MSDRFLKLTAAALFCGVTGCFGAHSSPDAPPVTYVQDNRVVLDSVIVLTQRNNVLDITGQAHLRPGLSGPLAGRVDIEFVAADGEILEGLPVPIVPRKLMGSEPVTFHTLYGYVPPKGSTMRVYFVDADTAAREDFEETEGSGGDAAPTGGAAPTRTGGGARTGGGNHYGGWHQSGFGGNFGNTTFAPGGRR